MRDGQLLIFPERESEEGVDLNPSTAYEAITRQMVENLAEELKEIRRSIDGIFWLIAGSIAADVVMRAIGVAR